MHPPSLALPPALPLPGWLSIAPTFSLSLYHSLAAAHTLAAAFLASTFSPPSHLPDHRHFQCRPKVHHGLLQTTQKPSSSPLGHLPRPRVNVHGRSLRVHANTGQYLHRLLVCDSTEPASWPHRPGPSSPHPHSPSLDVSLARQLVLRWDPGRRRPRRRDRAQALHRPGMWLPAFAGVAQRAARAPSSPQTLLCELKGGTRQGDSSRGV